MQKALIVEKDHSVAYALRRSLEQKDLEVYWTSDLQQGLDMSMRLGIQMIIVCPSAGGTNGSSTNDLHPEGAGVAKVILPPREAAAADAIDLVDVVARVDDSLSRLVRRPRRIESYENGDLAIDFKRHTASVAGVSVPLTTREYAILRYLVERRGQVVTREELLDVVWESSSDGLTRTVDVHIAKLRSKLGDSTKLPRFIVTVHRSGYKFIG